VDAYELLEHGILTQAQFREFTCGNAALYYGSACFAGTAVETDAARVLAEAR
jgi:hypothetical protein